MRERKSFDEGWAFSLCDQAEAKELWFDDSCWEKVTLPHDWAINGGFEKQAPSGEKGGFTRGGTGWVPQAVYG